MRTDATDAFPRSRSRWARRTALPCRYDQLTTGPENAATAGSLIGDYHGVRNAVKEGLLSMLTGGLTPDAALRIAQREADAAIAAYNDRIGGG